MLSPPPVPVLGLAVRPLVNLQGLADLGDDVAESGYLTIKQVRDRLVAAGYNDSAQTIRRLIANGKLGKEGAPDGWYRTELGGYRMVSVVAVDRLIAARRKQAAEET